MRLKIRCELWLPGLPGPAASSQAELEPASPRRIAEELGHAATVTVPSAKAILAHLAALEPLWTEDFIRSI